MLLGQRGSIRPRNPIRATLEISSEILQRENVPYKPPHAAYHSIAQPYACVGTRLPPTRLRITATMSRMTWRSSMQSERIVVLRRALSQKTGMFLRVPPSGDAGTCCLGLCEKRPCDGQSPSSVYQSYPGSLTSTTLFGGESPIVCGGYGIVSPWSRLRAAERKPGDHVGREGTCAQAQGDSLWLR